jgi:hypothetical protein
VRLLRRTRCGRPRQRSCWIRACPSRPARTSSTTSTSRPPRYMIKGGVQCATPCFSSRVSDVRTRHGTGIENFSPNHANAGMFRARRGPIGHFSGQKRPCVASSAQWSPHFPSDCQRLLKSRGLFRRSHTPTYNASLHDGRLQSGHRSVPRLSMRNANNILARHIKPAGRKLGIGWINWLVLRPSTRLIIRVGAKR